ncbi:hypothetical protein RCXUPER_218 [Rhodobacter phage RcXuper]|nr:hypothetical protein RCXUPER_218 [Rhodobacter phage RcXuper]
MTTKWTISATDRRAIRAYAARAERLQPRQIDLDLGYRYSISDVKKNPHDVRISSNVYLVDETPDWEESDLHDLRKFSEAKAIPLTRDGRALVDIYVYKNDADRELLTNVQAYIETVDGKPVMVKLAGTGSRSIGRAEIKELMGP